MKRSRPPSLQVAAAAAVVLTVHSPTLSMAWSLNSLSPRSRCHPPVLLSCCTSLSLSSSSFDNHINLRSKVRRFALSSAPFTSLSSTSSSSEPEATNLHIAASYETWGDGNLLSETFAELYSPSIFSNSNDAKHNQLQHQHHQTNDSIPRRRPHLPEWLLTRAATLGYIHPTMMQRLALDVLLPRMEISSDRGGGNDNNIIPNEEEEDREEDEDDVILHAQTGSGKTLAYLLPTLCDIDSSRQVLQAVIIVPTRELGLQVVKIARRLAGGGSSGMDERIEEEREEDDDDEEEDDLVYDNGESLMRSDNGMATTTPTTATSATTTIYATARRKKIIIMPILQGASNTRVRGWAKSEPPHIMVGTPEELRGLLSRFVRRNNNDFVKSVSTVVVDEVDACLASGRRGGSGQQGGALHEVLSKYLGPTSGDHRDEDEDIDDTDFTDGRRRRRRSRRESAATQSQQIQQQQQQRRRRTIFASATIPQHNHFAKSCVRNGWTIREPTVVTVGAGPGGTVGIVPPTLEHVYVVCKDASSKMGGLRRWMKKELLGKEKGSMVRRNAKKVLIFCNDSNPRQLEELAHALSEDWNGVLWKEGPSSTDGEKDDGVGKADNYDTVISILRLSDTPGARATAMAGFRGPLGNAVGMGRGLPADEKVVGDARDGKLRILLSTDLAARGLDVPDVTHVVNFDLPGGGGGGDWYDAYVHRGGRAGRLGRKGKVMTLITPEEEFVMGRLANRLSLDLKCVARQVGGGV